MNCDIEITVSNFDNGITEEIISTLCALKLSMDLTKSKNGTVVFQQEGIDLVVAQMFSEGLIHDVQIITKKRCDITVDIRLTVISERPSQWDSLTV